MSSSFQSACHTLLFRRDVVRGLLPRLVFGGIATLACVSGLSGCQAVNGVTSASAAQLRIIDATPDAGGIDIYSGNAAIAYNLGFGTITSYVPVTPSTYTFSIDTAGTRTALTTVRATLGVAKQYTLLISNAAAALQSQVLIDQSQPAPSGQVSLRFLDEAISPGAIDIYLVPAGSTLAKVNPLQTGVVFGTNTGYLNVPTGTYTMYVVANGTVISTTTVPLYTGASTAYPSGSARTVLILDQTILTSPAVQVVTTSDYESATATQ
ncbi:hypothetical protein Terro_3609 [Terriglobus roseus DSM 18391]|uniref:DUF4397 domain-containing protein n=1 Tax=Terriglobus roseus (strain DSM 18391 / NRRL B-41598 / KBS 63) TaxID=926566 RepID=I3ZKQ5_TERRK|nr:hypothetical protein Terro_3609 [Terriglobus roseus DSM 18391]